jgi:hypothetical protein
MTGSIWYRRRGVEVAMNTSRNISCTNKLLIDKAIFQQTKNSQGHENNLIGLLFQLK